MAIMLFAQGIIVARWLGPEQYGIAALIMSYPALLFGFFDAKASTATTKFVGEFSIQGRRESALAMCRLSYLVDAGIALLTLVVVAATAGWAESHIVHTPGVAWLMTVYSLAYLFQAFASPSRAVLLLQGEYDNWRERGHRLGPLRLGCKGRCVWKHGYMGVVGSCAWSARATNHSPHLGGQLDTCTVASPSRAQA